MMIPIQKFQEKTQLARISLSAIYRLNKEEREKTFLIFSVDRKEMKKVNRSPISCEHI